MSTQNALENEAIAESHLKDLEDTTRRAMSIYEHKRKMLDKAADTLIIELHVRAIDISKSTALLVLANAIAVYEREGG